MRRRKTFGLPLWAGLLALGLSGFNVAAVRADGETDCSAVTSVSVLDTCLRLPESDVTLAGDISISGGQFWVFNGSSAKLDLNGHSISSTSGFTLGVWKGSLEITGSGTIASNGVALSVYGGPDNTDATPATNLTVGSGVNLQGGSTDSSYGLAIFQDFSNKTVAHKVKVSLDGVNISGHNGMTVLGNIKMSSGAPEIQINGGKITADAASGVAIYGAGSADYTISGTEISGGTALGVKSGTYSLSNATVTSKGARPADTVDTNGNGINGAGAVFQIEDNPGYAGGVKISVNGGTYTSENYTAFFEYPPEAQENLEKITISGGIFKNAEEDDAFIGVNAEKISISGGQFVKASGARSVVPASSVAPGYYQNVAGYITRSGSSSSSSSSLADMPPSDATPSTTYEVLSGADQSVDVSSPSADLTVRFKMNYTIFLAYGKVYVDGQLVSDNYYDSRSGSTIVELKNSYLKTLTNGEHTLKVTFGDYGSASTHFTLANAIEIPDSPSSGDLSGKTSASASTFVWFAVFLTLTLGAFVITYRAALRADHDNRE